MCTKEADSIRENTDDEPLRAAEAASIMRVHVNTVYRLVNQGDLAAYRIGTGQVRPRGLRIYRSVVMAFLADSAVRPEGAAA